MKRYSSQVREQVRALRSEGKTYTEIVRDTGINFSKSTLGDLCKGVTLPSGYAEKIKRLNRRAIEVAWEVNRKRRQGFLESLDALNKLVVDKVDDKDTAKIALAMLCLGEASKYKTGRRAFSLGSSDPRIIVIFLELLERCFNYDLEKTRATVQCRADQDTVQLEKYWQNVTKIPSRLFYKPLIDPRTIGKSTKKESYKGVLRIDYFDTKVQLELESLAQLVYNSLSFGPVAQR